MNDEQNLNFTNISNPFEPPFQDWLLFLPANQKTSFTLCYCILLVLSVLSNVYVIAIVFRNKQMRTTINYLIVNMAISDLVGSIAAISPTLAFLHNMSFQWMVGGRFGSALCKIASFTRDVSISVSIMSMVAIGFDRFFAVVFPMSVTPKILQIRVVIPVIWIISVASFSIDMIIFKLVPVVPKVYLCGLVWPKGLNEVQSSVSLCLVVVILFFFIPFIMNTSLYIAIAVKIKNRSLPGQNSLETERRRQRENNGVIKMAVTIVMCFFACWLPYHIMYLLEIFAWDHSLPPALERHYMVLSEATVMLSYVSFFTNPFICLIFSSNFRKYLKHLFPFYFCFRNQVGVVENSLTRNHTIHTSRGRPTLIGMNGIYASQQSQPNPV